MATYEVEISYMVPEWGTVQVEADNADQAEELAVKEFMGQEDPEYIRNLVVDSVKEVNIG